MVEISASDSASSTIKDLSEKHGAIDSWHSAKNKDGRRVTNVLVHLEQQQGLMDDLQSKLSKEENWRISVIPVEATIPRPNATQNKDSAKNKPWLSVSRQITREELYNEVEKGAKIDSHFMVLVFLSTIVAAIGLINNNVAVIVGAMVIAPLLAPNLALAFGVAIGEQDLVSNAIKANITGLALTLFIAAMTSAALPVSLDSHELISRTYVGIDTIILALAAGAAGVLSLTTGLSGALVGVMVAVALMPPAVATGLFLGSGQVAYAYGAGLHLTVNVVCVSLAAQLVFFLSGVKPRSWYKRKKSEQSIKTNMMFWLGLFLIVAGLIALKNWL